MFSKNFLNHTLAIKLLSSLGNLQPKPQQIKLIENLLLKINCQHTIFFNQKLSESEKNCLLLAAEGKTIQQTAYLLSVKTSTVTTLRKRTLNKLGCRSMAHAVFVGLHHHCLCNNHFSLHTNQPLSAGKRTVKNHLPPED